LLDASNVPTKRALVFSYLAGMRLEARVPTR